jgi:riboflavin kinase/FMN adenylyltransferase
LTFDPNPKIIFGQLNTQEQLFSTEQKVRALGEIGVSKVFVESFDAEFFHMAAACFFEKVLVEKCSAGAIVVGADFRFGYKREGSVGTLHELGKRCGIKTYVAETMSFCNDVVKSSLIRTLIRNSDKIEKANHLLGRPYSIEGVIVKGLQNGRKLGFPTANLNGYKQLLPKNGVYSGFVAWQDSSIEDFKLTYLDHRAEPAVFNIGYKPSIKEGLELTVEAHILKENIGENELYGKDAIFYFVRFIREEKKFSSVNSLKTQILSDIDVAKIDIEKFNKD